MKKLLILAVVAVIFSACTNSAKETSDQTKENSKQITEVKVNDFEKQAGELAGEQVTMKGTVMHVCKHGGKRLFLSGDNPDIRVKVTTGENMASFKPELEGSEVSVQGMVHVQEIDEAYLNQWEDDVKADMKESDKKIHTGEEGHEENEGEKEETLKKIENMRKQLEESEKEKLTFYSVECEDYKIIK